MEILHAVECTGEGLPLLVLPGAFGCGRNWLGLSRRVTPARAMLLLDLRNHGRSFHHPAMDFDSLAADIERFRQSRQLAKIHLLGHSLGGKVALRYALNYPQHLASLMIVDIAPRAYFNFNFMPIFRAMRRVACSPERRRTELVAQLQAELGDGDASLAQFLVMANYSPTGWLLNLPILEQTMPQWLDWPAIDAPPYQGPAVLYSGQRSRFVQTGDLDLLRHYLPQVESYQFDKSGHQPQVDQAELFAWQVSAFLGRHQSQAAR